MCFTHLAKEDANVKIKLKLPPAPTKTPKSTSTEPKPKAATNTVVQVPVIQLERVEETMEMAKKTELPSTSDEEEFLQSENEMDVEQIVEDHDYTVDDYIIEEEADINTVIYDPKDPLGLGKTKTSSTLPIATNTIPDTTQVPSVHVLTAPKSYENANQEEKDQMVYEHIKSQNKKIHLLKDTVTKLLNEKKSFLKQQNELISDMNLLKERLRVAEDAEEVEVTNKRRRSCRNEMVNKRKISEKSSTTAKSVKYKSIANSNENLNKNADHSATSSSSESVESEIDFSKILQKCAENRVSSKVRFIMRDEFAKLLKEQDEKKRT